MSGTIWSPYCRMPRAIPFSWKQPHGSRSRNWSTGVDCRILTRHGIADDRIVRLQPHVHANRQFYEMGIAAAPTRVVVQPATRNVLDVRVIDDDLLDHPEADMPSECRT